MLDAFNAESSPKHPHEVRFASSELTKLYDSQPYTAYTEDLEFMWRWTIYQDQKLVQEGCSLTLDASRRAVHHVLAFFNASFKQTTLEQEW